MSESFLMFALFNPNDEDRAFYLFDDGKYDLEVQIWEGGVAGTEKWKLTGIIDQDRLLLVKNLCKEKLSKESYSQDKTGGTIIQYKAQDKIFHLVNDPVWHEIHTLLPEFDQSMTSTK